MERLKRLRAAQLNKTFQKEVMTAAQRKLQEEKDRAARESLQRAAWRRSPSPPSPRCLKLPAFARPYCVGYVVLHTPLGATAFEILHSRADLQ